MSERSILLLLEDIRFSIGKILEYTEGYTFAAYESDYKTKDAVERNFEIIGEAAGRVPEEFKNNNSEIEWRILKDFRNVLIHDYFGINNQIIWQTIQLRLPELLQKITVIIKQIHPTE